MKVDNVWELLAGLLLLVVFAASGYVVFTTVERPAPVVGRDHVEVLWKENRLGGSFYGIKVDRYCYVVLTDEINHSGVLSLAPLPIC